MSKQLIPHQLAEEYEGAIGPALEQPDWLYPPVGEDPTAGDELSHDGADAKQVHLK